MYKTITFATLLWLPAITLAGGNHEHAAPRHVDQHPHHEHGDHHGGHDNPAGRPGDPAKVARTIEVTMQDNMRFTPDALTFRAGETVRFVVRNSGKMRHEMVLGTLKELKEHMAMMRRNPDMQHQDPNMISLAPGESGEIVWQFDKSGRYDFACLLPGHMEAGMVGQIRIE